MSTSAAAAGEPAEPRQPDVSVARVEIATDELRRARSLAADAEDEWRFTVGSALEGSEQVQRVAEAAGLTVEEAQQLHDGGG